MNVPTMLNQDQHIGGKAVQIRDCYVWAEIFYLDSPTDYREYLPHQPQPHAIPGDDLVMLDGSSEGNFNLQGGWAIARSFLVVSGVVLCLMLYLWS
jgi:hypothetical protein